MFVVVSEGNMCVSQTIRPNTSKLVRDFTEQMLLGEKPCFQGIFKYYALKQLAKKTNLQQKDSSDHMS